MCWGPGTGTQLRSLEPWPQPAAGKTSAWMFHVSGTLHPARSKRLWQGLPGTRRPLLARGVGFSAGRCSQFGDIVWAWAAVHAWGCGTHGCCSVSQRGSWTSGSEFSMG